MRKETFRGEEIKKSGRFGKERKFEAGRGWENEERDLGRGKRDMCA